MYINLNQYWLFPGFYINFVYENITIKQLQNF